MKKYIQLILISLSVVASILFVYSLTLQPYTNEIEFNEKYSLLSGENGSEAYWNLRDSYLTQKYSMQEFSLTLLSLLSVLYLFLVKKEIKSPSSKKILFLWSIFASVVYVIWSISSMIIDQSRGAFAPWADTILIPLMITPFVVIFLLFMSIIHILVRYKNYTPSYNFKNLKRNDFLSYFGVVSILIGMLILLEIVTSWSSEPSLRYVYVLFLMMMLYFNLSLLKKQV